MLTPFQKPCCRLGKFEIKRSAKIKVVQEAKVNPGK